MTGGDGSNRFHAGRVAAGFIVLALGILLLLDRNGLWFGEHPMRHFGGVALIALGLARITGVVSGRRGQASRAIGGSWLVFVGLWLIASQAHWWGLTFHTSWPLLLIGWGCVMVLRELLPGGRRCAPGGHQGLQEN